MKGTLVWAMLGMWALFCMSGCVTKATDEELENMCDNLVKLRGEIPKPSSARIESDITMQFKEKAKELTQSQENRISSLTEEMNQKIEVAATDQEKATIQGEYGEKIEAVKAEIKPELEAMNAKKSEAIESAKSKVKESEAKWRTAVETCVADAKKESVSQKVARCRIDADSTDKYWNVCR